jgi:hypothetical protein
LYLIEPSTVQPSSTMRRLLVTLSSLLVLSACGDPSGPGALLGLWGSPEAEFVVSRNGAAYDAACASGEIARRIVVAGDGAFDVPGTLTTWGGAPPPHHSPSTRDVRFVGRVTGDRLTLDIVLDGVTDIGPLDDLRRNERREPALCP